MFIKRRIKDENRMGVLEHQVREAAKVEFENSVFNKALFPKAIPLTVCGHTSSDSSEFITRQSKLRELLLGEAQRCVEQIESAKETLDQRRARLERQAVELKTQQEDERKKIVDEKLELQWKNSVDELRLENSKLAEIETAAINLQLAAERRKAGLEYDRQQDALFESLNQEKYHSTLDREQAEAQKKCMQNLKVKLDLDKQMEDRRRAEIEQRMKQEKEHAELLAELEKARANSIQAEAKRTNEVRELCHAESAVFRKKLEKEQRDRRLADEQALVMEQIAKERERDEKTIQEHKLFIEEVAQYLSVRHALKEERNEREKQLDRLHVIENDKLWNKRFDQLQTAEKARRELLKKVYAERAEQVKSREQQISVMKKEHLETGGVLFSGTDVGLHRREKINNYRASLEQQIKEIALINAREEMNESLEKAQDDKLESAIRSAREKQRAITEKYIRNRT